MNARLSQTFYRYFPVAQQDRDWGICVTTVGQTRVEPGTHYPPAVHPKGYNFRASIGRRLREFQIVYITAGQGWFKSDVSGPLNIDAGCVFLVFPGVWHSYGPNPATGWDERWVGFTGALARRLAEKGFFSPANPVFYPGKEHVLFSLFTELINVGRSNHPASQKIIAGLALSILALLHSARQFNVEGADHGLDVIRSAITRMHEGSGSDLSIPELASNLNVSYRWFRRAFAHHMGMSPHHYLIETRLAHARDLLSQTTMSVKEIALQTGFGDEQYFCRMFHKKVRVTPSAWRRHALGSQKRGLNRSTRRFAPARNRLSNEIAGESTAAL